MGPETGDVSGSGQCLAAPGCREASAGLPARPAHGWAVEILFRASKHVFGCRYPLMPPIWMPRMKNRWPTRKTRISGMTSSTEPAINNV